MLNTIDDVEKLTINNADSGGKTTYLTKDVAEWIEYDTDKIGQMLNTVDDINPATKSFAVHKEMLE